MKRFSVICLQCGLTVDRVIDAETAHTEIHPENYQQKCKIAPKATDFACPELEGALERSRRWDPIFQSGMSRPASTDDVVLFPEVLSEAEVENQKLVADKAEHSVEVANLSRPASTEDVVVFPEALSETEVKNQKLVADKADLSVEVANLSRPVSTEDVVVFPEVLSEGEVRNQKLVAEKAEPSTEDLSARGGVTDMVNVASTPDDLKLDELRSSLSKALERFSART
jgi:hypothetical protein